MSEIKISTDERENEIFINGVSFDFDYNIYKRKEAFIFLSKKMNCKRCRIPQNNRSTLCKFIPCGNTGAVKRNDKKRGYLNQLPF